MSDRDWLKIIYITDVASAQQRCTLPAMSTTNTLFGFDHLAHGMRSATPGIKTGASSRPGGKTHLFDTVTKRTACGRERGQMAVTLVPANVTEATWPVRVVLCAACRKQVSA